MRLDNMIISDSFKIAQYLDRLSIPYFIPTPAENEASYAEFANLMAEINAFGKELVSV